MSLSSILSPFTFLMDLIIYVGLLLLTAKVLSLPFDPQDNTFLSWAHSYPAFHNQSNCWVCGALPSSSIESFPCSGPPFAWPGTHWGWTLSHAALLQTGPTGYVALTYGHGFPLVGWGDAPCCCC